MYIIANKALVFLRQAHKGDQVSVNPGPRPQRVPDWVRDSSAFQQAAKDGSVKEADIDTSSHQPQTEGAPTGDRRNGSKFERSTPGSMDRVSMTDPIWDFSSKQDGPIFIKRLSGEVHQIDSGTEDEPDDADLKPEEELRITEVTTAGRSELRSDIETAFSGPEWPPPHSIVQAFRRYAVKVLDVNGEAYRETILRQKRDANAALSAMARNLLAGLFGREWENSPGERVIRIRWQDGPDGWTGEEISVIAGNDADPTCLYHQLMGDAIKLRYRFHDPPPVHLPGEPLGLGVTSFEWWKYIGLKERHDQAMVLQPYLQDRIAHWQAVYAVRPSKATVLATTMEVRTRSERAESYAETTNSPDSSADFGSTESRSGALAAYTAAWECSEASLARTAKVDPSDLTKWKKGELPVGSEKKARIEKALRNNEPATPLANHPKNS